MRRSQESYPLHLRETRPILIGEESGIRFILEQRSFEMKKNAGELPFPIKDIRCEDRAWGEIDIPEEEVIAWLKGWAEGNGKKKGGRC